MGTWRHVDACVRGTSHVVENLPCQDARKLVPSETANAHEVLIIVVADGAGAARHADIGSALACEVLAESVRAWLAGDEHGLASRELAVLALTTLVLPAFRQKAEEIGTVVDALSCTLLAAVLHPQWTACLQIGDGAIVVGDAEGYRPVFWPQTGEYANSTRFVTDEDAAERMEFQLIEPPVNEIAIFTDGIQSMALHYDTRTAYGPFFRPFFERLRLEEPGVSASLSAQLTEFLGSQRVEERTTDDKTLVLATRIPPVGVEKIAGSGTCHECTTLGDMA
jgi:hypothetical protein